MANGILTLSNWHSLEIRILDGGEELEYRYHNGDVATEWVESDIVYIIASDYELRRDTDEVVEVDPDEEAVPAFHVYSDKGYDTVTFCLSEFMRID